MDRCIFFFSSRRRHTRWTGDWSSDVCSSDLTASVSAVSCGIVEGEPLLDLDYEEDSSAEVDLNVVMTSGGRLVELQGTAEGQPFDRAQLDRLLELGAGGMQRIEGAQLKAVAAPR